MSRATCLALLALAGACGSVTERGDCRTSAECPRGEYCARTSEGSVCWPDAVPPELVTVEVTCLPVDCPRDGQLLVTAEVADDREVFAVEATADVDSAHAFPLTRQSGTTWTGAIDLAELDFPFLDHETVVTAHALDGARNVDTMDAGVLVTRVRWFRALDASIVTPTPVAVRPDGVVVLGGSDGKLRFFSPDGSPAGDALAVAGSAIAQPPSIGAQAIWVGANDGKLYGLKPDGSGELSPPRTCTASGVAKGPPALLTTAGVDVAFGAFSNGRIYASGPTCVPTSELSGTDSLSVGVVLDGGRVFGITSAALEATLHRIDWDGVTFKTSSGWSSSIGGEVVAPVAITGGGRVLTGGKDRKVVQTTSEGTVDPLVTLANAIAASPIVLSDGHIVAGDVAGKLHRLAADGSAVWTSPPDLGAEVHAPMALSGGPIRFLVATADGRVHAIDEDGVVLWSGALTGGSGLSAGNISPPDANGFSTAYFAGGDGKLYAVIVEGSLDTAAPWPKAWHDRRNTSRAGPAF